MGSTEWFKEITLPLVATCEIDWPKGTKNMNKFTHQFKMRCL